MENEIIRRYFNNTATQEERQLVNQWLSDSASREAVLAVIEELWKEAGAEGMEPPAFEAVWKNALAQEKKETGKLVGMRGRRWLWAGTAAACVLFLVVGVGIGYSLNRRTAADTKLSANIAGNAGRSVVMLSNGTEVVLNGSSRLLLDECDQDQVHQTVYLEGEASFTLGEKSQPLIIKTKDIVATAKGSQLKISASPTDSVVKVSVKKGKAEVKPNNEQFGPFMKLRFQKRTDSSNIATNAEDKPKILPLTKLRPVVVKEKEEMTFNKNNGATDIGLDTIDSTLNRF